MALTEYKVFRRESVPGNPRVRWHHIDTVKANSRPDALRRFGIPVEPRVDSVRVVDENRPAILVSGGWRPCPDVEPGLYLAWKSGEVSFEHYNVLGTFVPAVGVFS